MSILHFLIGAAMFKVMVSWPICSLHFLQHSSILLLASYRFLHATAEFTFCYSNIFHQHSVWSRASFLKSKSYFFCSGLSVKAVGSMEELSAQFLVMFVAICKHLKSLQHKEKWKGFHSEGTGFLVWRPVFCGCSCVSMYSRKGLRAPPKFRSSYVSSNLHLSFVSRLLDGLAECCLDFRMHIQVNMTR